VGVEAVPAVRGVPPGFPRHDIPPFIARCCGFLAGFPQGLPNWSELHFAALPQARRKMPFVIRTLCQNVAARAQADALNTTGIDARTGEHRPWRSPSTSHEFQPPAPRSSLPKESR